MAKYQRVIAGDLVINKLRTWQGGFGIAKQEGIVSPAYYVFRFTDSQVRPEFVDLLLKSPTYLAAITRVTRWMPPSQYDTAWEDLKGIPIWYPPLGKQDSMLEQSTNIRNVQSILVQLSALQSKYDEYRKSMSNYLFLGTIAPEKTGKQNND
jgi:type I restriction enzyme S subunit